MIYAFDDYELDMLTLELRHDGEVVHLEPQVFGVLAHLVENRDRVVSKVELLDEVWLDRFVSESALTSRIQAARKACGDSGREQRVIRTRHGKGYRFVADVVDLGERASKSETGAAPVAAPVGARPPVATESRVVGRDPELEVLDRAVLDTIGGSRDIVFVGGEAGMGKSTLVDAVVERADGNVGLRFLRARCRSSRGLPEPYVSLLDGLARFAREHGEAVIDTIDRVAPMWMLQLPSLVAPERLDALGRRVLGGTRERMLREGVDLLEDFARQAPLVVVIEDLHWADPATLEVVEWLGGGHDATSLLVIATYALGDGAVGDLEAAVSRLTLDGAARALTLEPLDTESVRRLMIEWLDAAAVDDDLAELVGSHSGGNPLFVAEEVDMWFQDEAIAVIDGSVVAPGGLASLQESVPESVRQLIERGLDGLDDDEVATLEVAAVIGREFPAFAVATGTDMSVEATEAAMAALARRGRFITAVGDDAWPDGTVSTVFRFNHYLHQQILHDRSTAGRRAGVHQTVGERLELAFGHRSEEHVAELARHFLAAGDSARAVRYLQRAGEQALARSAHQDAEEFLRRALDTLRNLPESDDRDLTEINIRASLGPALIATLGWSPVEVEQNYGRALELCGSMDPPPERFIVRYGLASVHELRGEYNRSEELLSEQLADGAGLGVETNELLACSTFHQGAFDRSLGYARDGLDLWDPDEHSVFMARYGEHPGVSCNTWGALSAWYLGKPELSLELAQQAVDWGSANTYALSTARVQFSFLHQYRDEPERCLAWAEETVGLADEQGFPFRAAQARIMLGWCEAAGGRPGEGVDDLLVALAAYRTFGARMDEPYFLGVLADAELRAGRVDDALGHIDEGAAVIRDTTRSFFYEPELDRLRAVGLLQRNGAAATDEAVEALDRAAAMARNRGGIALSLRIAVTRLELDLGPGAGAGELERLLAGYAPAVDAPDVVRARQVLAGLESS